MTALTPRQRVKANAALSLIALHGHNPRTVQNAAKARMAEGYPAAIAYTKALEAFALNVPSMRNTLEIALELVGKSDDATLSKYDAALNHYNATGDEGQLEGLAPMIVEDAKALAIRNGDATEADTLYWDIQSALGVTQEAFSAEPYQPEAQAPAEPAAPQASSFQFGNPSQIAPTAPPQQATQAPLSYLQSEMGYRPRPTGEQARREAGVPLGGIEYIKTEMGYRAVPTGVQARREAGVPIGSDA